MSLKDILDSFYEGRNAAKEFLGECNESGEPQRMEDLADAGNTTYNKIPDDLRSSSRLENVAHFVGIFSKPKAAYYMIKLVIYGSGGAD